MKKEKKTTIIRKKLTIRILTVVTLTMLGVAVCLSAGLHYVINKSSRQRIMSETNSYENEIEGWVNGILKQVDTVYQTIKRTEMYLQKETLEEYLTKITLGLNEAMPDGAYVGTSKNEFYDAIGREAIDGYIVSEQGWFQDGLKHDEIKLGNPCYVEQFGSNLITASAKLDENTVFGADISLNKIAEIVNSIETIGDGGSFLLDRPSGFIVTHENEEYIGRDAKNMDDVLIQYALENNRNTDKIDRIIYQGQHCFVKLNEIDGTDWVLATYAKRNVLFENLYKIVITGIIVCILYIILIGSNYYSFIKKTTAPIARLTETINEITTGNFRVEPVITGDDEITVMSEALLKFIQQMRNTILELTGISNLLSEEAVTSTNISSDVNRATGVQTESMKQMKITVEELSRSVEEIAEEATILAEISTDANNESNTAIRVIDDTVKAVKTGSISVAEMAEKMDDIREVITELDEVVKEVGNSSKEITSITAMIGTIASQTSLLALNASIEAARAGEAGKGFAVVASEISQLATSCSDAVSKIEDIVTTICKQVNTVVKKTSDTVVDIQESQQLVDSTLGSFELISDKVNDANQKIQIVKDKINEVDKLAMEMAAITEEQSAGTEEILATTEEVYQHASSISDNVEKLTETADNLQHSVSTLEDQIKQFTI